MCTVHHLAPIDVAILVQRNDQGAAEFPKRSVKVRFVVLRMILFREHEHDPGLAAKWLAPAGRHIGQFGIFTVALEDAGDSRLHVRGRAPLLRRRGGQLLSSLEQRDVESHIEGGGKHRVGLNRLVGSARGAAGQQFELRCCPAAAMTTNLRTTGGRTPILQFARFFKDQLEVWPFEIAFLAVLFCCARHLQRFARDRLSTQHGHDRVFVVDR